MPLEPRTAPTGYKSSRVESHSGRPLDGVAHMVQEGDICEHAETLRTPRKISPGEQVSHPSLLERIYYNRTATGTVRVGTRWTQQMLDVGKNAAKQLNCRTGQYGMKRRIWNLQGGGRWFEPSIAHHSIRLR
jgi:hypothetical protein